MVPSADAEAREADFFDGLQSSATLNPGFPHLNNVLVKTEPLPQNKEEAQNSGKNLTTLKPPGLSLCQAQALPFTCESLSRGLTSSTMTG